MARDLNRNLYRRLRNHISHAVSRDGGSVEYCSEVCLQSRRYISEAGSWLALPSRELGLRPCYQQDDAQLPPTGDTEAEGRKVETAMTLCWVHTCHKPHLFLWLFCCRGLRLRSMQELQIGMSRRTGCVRYTESAWGLITECLPLWFGSRGAV